MEAIATVLLSKVGVVVKLFGFFAIAGRAGFSKWIAILVNG